MKQVLIIHGGDSFSSYESYLENLRAKEIDYDSLKLQKKWKTWIAEQLPEIDVLLPTFPNGYNAAYEEWKIYFEKLIPFFGNDTHLIGHSLGAMFLTKYLHDNPLPQKVRQLILVAGQYGERDGDDMGSFLVESAQRIDKSAQEIHLFYSQDDPIVDYASLAAYQEDMPAATAHTFSNRGHFLDETFPEILELLQKD